MLEVGSEAPPIMKGPQQVGGSVILKRKRFDNKEIVSWLRDAIKEYAAARRESLSDSFL